MSNVSEATSAETISEEVVEEEEHDTALDDAGIKGISFARQAGLIDPEKAAHVHVNIIGIGTVGSHAAVAFAEENIGSMLLVDDDKVEPHNLPSQSFIIDQLGQYKTDAARDNVKKVNENTKVRLITDKLIGGEKLGRGPVILAVDNMDARKSIMDLSVIQRADHDLMIDVRMGATNIEIFALDPSDPAQVEEYRLQWFPQSEASSLPCGGRTVSFVGPFIGSILASYMMHYINGGKVGSEIPKYFAIDLARFVFQPMGLKKPEPSTPA